MDQQAALQQETGSEIERIIANFKKDPASRKTLEYFQERLGRLEEQWGCFDATDSDIRNNFPHQLDHPYFKKGYFDAVRAAYEEHQALFKFRIERLQAQVKSNDQETDDNPHTPAPSHIKATEGVRAHNGVEVAQLRQRQQCLMDTLQRTLDNVETTAVGSKHFWELSRANINKYWTQIEAINVETSHSPTDSEDTSKYIEMEDNVQRMLVRCAAEIEDFNRPQQSAAPRSSEGIRQAQFSLPQIAIPKFNGDYLNWRQFFDLFTQMVDNQQMSNCQKMWYLKTNLTEEAAKLIRHLPLTEDSYTSAWQMLQDRYNNVRMLSTAFFNRLLQQPASTTESASSIKALHDTTNECLQGLKNLGMDTRTWDPLIVHLLMKKLDRATHVLYEQSLKQPRALPSLNEFLSFLEIRFQSLETLGNKGHCPDEHGRKPAARSFTSVAAGNPIRAACVCCNHGNHNLYACPQFLRLTPEGRLAAVRRFKFCINCLSPGHMASACLARNCTKCSGRHNTLLHTTRAPANTAERGNRQQNRRTENEEPTTSAAVAPAVAPVTSATAVAPKNKGYVFLSTGIISLEDLDGNIVQCRALLDSGSQLNFITEKLSKRLKIPEFAETMRILGIGDGTKQANKRVNLVLKSRTSNFAVNLEAFVLRQITPNQPTQRINTADWNIPTDVRLADPHFGEPGPIDVLIGAELFHHILTVGQLNIGEGLPLLQNTHLGWIVAGKVGGTSPPTAVCGISIEDELKEDIERFWKVEELRDSKECHTTEERRCEDHFAKTVSRLPEGRFVVRLPFKANKNELGTSHGMALRRFTALERRLAKQSELKEQYTQFMAEYKRLGHMEKIDISKIQGPHYFLPHHCVLKPDSTTTKLRVVFDASAKTTTNVSLNDILTTGPTIQEELLTTLLQFRLHRYVFTADIEKMYRQILVDQDDRQFQIILWRDDPSDELQAYQLNTVTYGTTSAPYLATKCLQRLAFEGARRFPLGAEVLKKHFYVDDVMTGSDNLATAINMQGQLNELLQTAGFTLRKWCANDQNLLKNIPANDVALQLDLDINNTTHIKTLGQGWVPNKDQFVVNLKLTKNRQVSKRTALSDIAQLFDPLGFLGPVIITAKMFMQKLWTSGFDWDTPLPEGLQAEWMKFRENLKHLQDVKVDRHIFSHRSPQSIQLHAFADASEKAYGAVIYLRAVNKDKTVTVRLLCAKSRVAPLKTLSIPRLELCAAMLAAELAHRVIKDLHLEDCEKYMWTDSEIVLGWINATSSSFHTFVANRISAIQRLTNIQHWRHVRSNDNPADLLSRGIPADRLATCNLWFYGPLFLHANESFWPPPYTKGAECETERKNTTQVLSAVNQTTNLIYDIEHHNNFRRLQRVVAYVQRFCHNLKAATKKELIRKSGALKPTELHKALILLVKNMQLEEFKRDLEHLQHFSETPKDSPISSLTPFIDEEGTIRVGGRLEASSIPYEAKHPLLLPYSHPHTKMLMTSIHTENLHCGPQALLATTKQKFWPVKGKTIARSIVQQCVRCVRAKPRLLTQIMGNLPAHRVQPARPFINAGVDFCGPIKTHYKVRGKHPQKTYIAVFCCFSTKAVHLELVTDLSTNGFIAAIQRFVGRRGNCQHLYCDNATNFVGASNQLKNQIHTEAAQEQIQTTVAARGIEFHFIPPRAPHFGGLWEAAVKSAKYLLQRCIGAASLTYEELETVIIEIEAVLNSRPLTPMSTNPNDLMALTPGHFLIGEPLTNSTDPTAEVLKANLPAKLQIISSIKEDFWKRWQKEYLSELQQRHKWQQKRGNLLPGTMVIIKEDNCPVMKWSLGRVIQTFPGADGVVRVAEIQTATSILRRPVHRLAPLPIEPEEQETNNDQPTATVMTASLQPTQDGLDGLEDGEINSEDDASPPPRKRRYNPFKAATSTILILLLLLPLAMSANVNISSFKSNPGIHFENLGTAHIISDQWDIVVYYELRYYWKELKWANVTSNKLKELCQEMPPNDPCFSYMQHFQQLLQELNDSDELLRQAPARSKRGAINIIGNLANSLFGVLDSEYAQHMSQVISTIDANEDRLRHLIKNQTTLINSTAKIMRASEGRFEKQFQALETEITTIIEELNKTNSQNYQLRLSQLMLLQYFQLSLSTANLQKTQSLLLDLITDVHHGKISANLIHPMQLRREMTTIKAHLPPALRMPETNDNIALLYKLMTAEGRIVGSTILFKLTLPLITTEHYELYKITPVPVLINNSFIAIRPSSEYMIINQHRTQYYPLSEEALSSCLTVLKGDFMCHQRHPLYQKGSNVSLCEFNLMNQVTDQSSCQLEIFTGEQFWAPLHQSNQWIYSLRGQVWINVVCAGNLTQIHLHSSGILTIPAGCTLKQDIFTIQGHKVFTSNARASFIPASNLSEVINRVPNSAQLIHHPTIFRKNQNDLESLQKDITQQQLEETLNQVKTNDTHQFIISYFSVICLIIIFGFFISTRIYFRRRLSKGTPIPAPRTQHQEAFTVHI